MADLRPSRDVMFMNIAHEFSTRGTCNRAQVGAIIVKEDHIISHGYNGAPPKRAQCNEVGCEILTVQRVPDAHYDADTAKELRDEIAALNWRYSLAEDLVGGVALVRLSTPDEERCIEMGCQRAIHAEANALAYAARVGVSCENTVMYSTHEPCKKCAELILVAGIREVYFGEPYRLGASDFLQDAGVLCVQF